MLTTVGGGAGLPGVSSVSEIPDNESECSGSMYNEYDPFDYLYSGSGAPSIADPIYAAVIKQSPKTPPPLPPRAWSTLEKRKSIDRRKNRLYENIKLVKRNAFHHDCELRAFCTMVQDVRSKYYYFTSPFSKMAKIFDTDDKFGTIR